MTTPFVTKLNQKQIDQLKLKLENQDFSFAKPAYTHFQAKKPGLSITLYTSGKLVVQGKQMQEFIEFYLEPELLQSFEFSHPQQDTSVHTSHIGIDESGKGDYFGPLCVAGVYSSHDEMKKLMELGVKDSKLLTDKMILKIAKEIKKHFCHHVIVIKPTKYNELITKFGNLNHLLGWGHATAIDYLVKQTDCKKVVLDKFAAEHVVQKALKQKKLVLDVTQKVRAEADPVVAAASILARATFVLELEKLAKQIGISLPKGASKKCIETGKKIVRTLGEEALFTVAKRHFKTTINIMDGI